MKQSSTTPSDSAIATASRSPAALLLNALSLLSDVSTDNELRTEFVGELTDKTIDGLVGVIDRTYPTKKEAKKIFYEEKDDSDVGGFPVTASPPDPH